MANSGCQTRLITSYFKDLKLAVHLVDQKLVRKAFYACTPAEGSPEQKGRLRRQRFLAALDWAEQEQLIGVGEIEGFTYLWLARPKSEEEELY